MAGSRWNRLAPLSAVAFVALVVVSAIVQGSTPSPHAGGAKVLAWYEAHRGREQASAVLIGASVVVGLLFYGVLRRYLRRSGEVAWLASVGFGGAVLFAAGAALEAAALFALSDRPAALDPAATQALNLIPEDFTPVVNGIGIAVLLGASGVAIVRSRLLPAWLGWAGIALGLIALFPWIEFVSLIGIGIWSIVAGVLIYRREAAEPVQAAAALPV